jgi:hypothetical protein
VIEPPPRLRHFGCYAAFFLRAQPPPPDQEEWLSHLKLPTYIVSGTPTSSRLEVRYHS